MKKIAMILIPGLVLFACSNEKGMESKPSNETNNQQEMRQEHSFHCPMHPEVTGKEGDTCPKCGMKLEHSDAVSAADTYFMQFATNPAKIKPGQTVTLSFLPKKRGNPTEQVALDTEHEKKIHLILVSEDLSWFDHIHPEHTADGSYKTDARFPAPGKYKVFADYKPNGSGHVVDKIDIDISGTAPAPIVYPSEKLTGNADDYALILTPNEGKLMTGPGAHIQGVLKKNGKIVDANSLDNYLGAKAHMVVISLNEKEYLHVHPRVVNGKFDIHAKFDKPGIYRSWIQFNANGKLHTIDFTMNVAQGQSQDKTSAHSVDDHSGHSH